MLNSKNNKKAFRETIFLFSDTDCENCEYISNIMKIREYNFVIISCYFNKRDFSNLILLIYFTCIF